MIVILTTSCVGVPLDYPKSSSQAITPSADSNLWREAQTFSATNDGQSGFLVLTGGQEGLGARL